MLCYIINENILMPNFSQTMVAHLFGLACYRVCAIVHETCKAIIQCSSLCTLTFLHNSNNLKKTVAKGFSRQMEYSSVCWLNWWQTYSHTALAMNLTDYNNHKDWCLIITQAVVNHSGFFRDLCIGWLCNVYYVPGISLVNMLWTIAIYMYHYL